jgi:hypothetical protein
LGRFLYLSLFRFLCRITDSGDEFPCESFRIPLGHFRSYRFRSVCRIDRLEKRNTVPPSTQNGSPKTSDTVEGWFPEGRCHLTVSHNLIGPTHPVGSWQTRSTTCFPWGVFREAGRLTTSRFPAGLSKLRTPGRRGQPPGAGVRSVAGKPALLSDSPSRCTQTSAGRNLPQRRALPT